MEGFRDVVRRLRRLNGPGRYAVATGLVGAAAAVQSAVEPEATHYYFIATAAVVACGLLLNRGSSLYAAVLSALAISYLFVEPRRTFALGDRRDQVALMAFLGVSVLLTFLTEYFRTLVDRLDDLEREKALLLRELSHRSQNNLQIVMAMVGLEARRQNSPETAERLSDLADRIGALGLLQERLRGLQDGDEVDASRLVAAVCDAASVSMAAGGRAVVSCQAEPRVRVPADTGLVLGLALNEAITNAVKHAFPGDRAGRVRVRLSRADDAALLEVDDDGVGCGAEEAGGEGTGLIDALVAQAGGRWTREEAAPGCRVAVRLPLG